MEFVCCEGCVAALEPPTSTDTPLKKHFARPKTSEDIATAMQASIPKTTSIDTNYCIKIWNVWRVERNTTISEQIPDIISMNGETLQKWMRYFVLEVRGKKG